MLKIAIFSDEEFLKDRDLSALRATLKSELTKIENLELIELCTSRATPPPEAVRDYGLVIFCGYSLSLLSSLFSTLEQGVPVLLYDLPGDSLDRELRTIFFSGVDSRRFPPSVLSQVSHSWNHREIVGICKQMVKDAPPQRPADDLDRARPVENTRKPSTRKGSPKVEDGPQG